MDLAYFNARRTLTGPEFVFISIILQSSVKLFQLIAVTTIPDPVADGIGLKVHHLLDLDAVRRR